MKQPGKISLSLKNTLGEARVSMSVYPQVIYNGKSLDLTSIFNLVKSRTPLYYMTEDQKGDFCVKFIPAKFVYKKDENDIETVDLYDVDGRRWCFHRPLYTDPSEAFNELCKEQMRLIERARAKLLELERREENIEVMRQLNENQ